VILRDYQQRCIEAVRDAYRAGSRRPLLVSPTGSGKTVMFSAIAKNATARGNRVMILVHRQELLDQVSDTLLQFEVPHGHIAADYPSRPHERVQVASIMTLVRRLADIRVPDVIVIDEAHHATASTWAKVIAAFPDARLLGVTATPCRLGGGGLGDVFDTLVMGPTVAELTAAGHLSPARIFAPPTINTKGVHTLMGEFVTHELVKRVDQPKVTGDAIEHYQRLTPSKRAIVFCLSLDHARHIAEGARAAGISAVMVDGGMDREIRRRVMQDFRNGNIQWLVSVNLVQEGFDVPAIEVGIFLRPTQSLGLWLQQAGRCLRPYPGKAHATLLDHAGNTIAHGLPADDRTWTLDVSRPGRSTSAPTISVKICPACFAGQRSGKSHCMNCGAMFPVEPRRVTSQDGELKELTPDELAARRLRREQGRAATLAQLEEIARVRGYQREWAKHVYESRLAKERAK